jgi:hypothetical protein
VTNQYQNQGLRFDHTALGITKGITAWMPTGEGWLRYPGGDPDPYANQFNFYLGFRGVVTFDFVDANGAFAPVDWAKITVFGVDPVDLAMTFENAAGEWGGDPVSGLNAQSEHATMEISSNTSSIARVHVYQMLKYPYPDVPPAWGVTEIQYDRSAWASAPIATPEPSSILLGAIGLGSALLARRRGIKQRL